MAKGRREDPCLKTYRLPFYCLGWVPLNQITATAAAADDAAADDAAAGEEPTSPPPPGSQLMLVLGGGGGEGRSGIQNALILSKFDFPSLSLSDEPVHRVGTNGDLPYRMAVHPQGDGLVCSFPNCCRHFEWELPKSRDYDKLKLISPGRILAELESVGQQTLAFSADGRMLAAGGEDGHLRVFKWPQMEIILDKAEAHPTVKDLDFSFDANFLVSLGNSGPCRVWDLTSLEVVANLPRENGEAFRFCRFSQNTDNNQILYIATMHDNKGKIASWDCLSWKRVGTSRIVRDSVSSFSVSVDGKLLAIGTPDGDVVVVNSDMRVQKVVKKAHLGIVTAVEFSQDSRALVSASMDSTARVTLLDGKKSHGLKLWHFLLVIVLAIIFSILGLGDPRWNFLGTKFLTGKR